ncbi:MAG: ATP-dependent DNA helicase RecG, partial [Clostridia bacterium]|nr:ATP-dependent DNA helicase RecG [Clostridia bacterium]
MDFTNIKGFGAKRIEMLKSAGVNSPADLISYFPKKYVDTTRLANLKLADDGSEVVILASTDTTPKVARIRKNLSIVKVGFTYDGAKVYCSWFNQPFMAKNIQPNRYYYICGKLKKKKSTYEIVAPTLYAFDGNPLGIIPVYKSIGKINSKLISEAVSTALKSIKIHSFIPEYISQKYTLPNINQAFWEIHNPTNSDQLERAKVAVAIEKLVYKFTAFELIKRKSDKGKIHRYDGDRVKLKQAIDRLPYTLTGAQSRSIEQILGKMNSPQRLNCLLEGDVGCGKTVVAFLAMYYSALSGYQSALMSPTEVLSKQHYEKAVEFFTPLGVECVYLSSSVTGAKRKTALEKLASAKPVCAIGTHSLISDEVVFSSLALAITDEQHRFGVAQRAKLENKTANADCIVMSATPIPRTLALSLYGELDRIIIDELPAKKAKIFTRQVPKEKEDDMWKYVFTRSLIGEQTYVVAPKITDDEDSEIESAERIFEIRKGAFGDKIALLHGKMKESEKAQVMARFNRGEVTVIVATTVIEVGIDVPSATTMIIYQADRFGLSQLHQL